MLSKKTRYALLALIKLGREYGKGPIQIKEISKTEIIPRKFLESILLDLKKLGYVDSKIGKTGGYFLIKSPDEVKMSEIIRFFEGALALIPCVSEKYYHPCEHIKDEVNCKIRKVFKEIREINFEYFKNIRLKDLM